MASRYGMTAPLQHSFRSRCVVQCDERGRTNDRSPRLRIMNATEKKPSSVSTFSSWKQKSTKDRVIVEGSGAETSAPAIRQSQLDRWRKWRLNEIITCNSIYCSRSKGFDRCDVIDVCIQLTKKKIRTALSEWAQWISLSTVSSLNSGQYGDRKAISCV